MLEPKRLRVNVKKVKTMVKSKKASKVRKEATFPCPACRNDVGSNSILWQFCKCSWHGRCSRTISLTCSCQTWVGQEKDTRKECLGTELNGQSLEVMEKFNLSR